MSEEIKEYRQSLFNQLEELFVGVDEVMDELWTGDNKIQMRTLMDTLTMKFGWDLKMSKDNDGLVRKYLRSHPNWSISRGCHGGIMKRADYEKKNATKKIKEALKAEMKAKIESLTND